MTARNSASYDIADISRDQGFAGATVHIHPTKWTTRRRNIIVRALRDGLSTAGYETSHFIERLTRAYGSTIANLSFDMIPLDAIRDDKREAMLAYTAAWVRIKLSQTGEVKRWHCNNYLIREWMARVEAGEIIFSFPLPQIPRQERASFIKEYLKDDEYSIRTQLADKIEAGEELTIFVEAA